MRHFALQNQFLRVLAAFQQFLNGNIDYSNVIKTVRQLHVTHQKHHFENAAIQLVLQLSCSSYEPALRKSPDHKFMWAGADRLI